MSAWIKCRVSNLWRNRVSSAYYARVELPKANGKRRDVWRSLKTKLESVAKLRLPGTLASIRANAGRLHGGDLTLGECAAVFMDRRRAQGRRGKLLKPRSLDYRQETIAMVRRKWPGFDGQRVSTVTASQCQEWANRARGVYSATRFNGMLESLRGMLAVGIEAVALAKNPAAEVERARLVLQEKFIPSRAQFTDILGRLDAVPSRKHARLSVRALAFTGLRPDEARHLKAADVDLQERTLLARVTKNGEARTIDLIDQAVELFEHEGIAKVLSALKKSCKTALGTIARELGFDVICKENDFKPLSAYSFRHLHGTSLLEAGVHVHVAARQLGHRDKGKTLLKTYAHGRREHVRKQMRGVVV